jgi:hypothetical protein
MKEDLIGCGIVAYLEERKATYKVLVGNLMRMRPLGKLIRSCYKFCNEI